MKTLRRLTIGLLFAALVLRGDPLTAASSGELLQQALYAEEVEGNLDSAIKIYDQIIKKSSAPPNHVAQALYRQGMCYMKIKDEASARAVLGKLVTEYSGQTEIVAKARPILDELTDFDPASLMPPGTLVYVEFGSPGQQVETVLSMLKGTPFENPLAAMGGNQGSNPNQKSPGDIVGALLNPSMMTEFKKIRSSAIGITGIAQNNPPYVAVLYPGKSDALRGLIQAALGMVGGPGESIQGMQTVNIKDFGAVAYDEKVIITTHPATQLEWCVKQYKGVISDPTLASSNKSFSKLSKVERQKNLLSIWANVDEGYNQLLKMFPEGQVPSQILSVNTMADFGHIDNLILTASVQTNGLGSKLDFQLKDGHHCLAYDLIRTPNISKTALEAVPAEAVALATFSLNQKDPAQAERVREKIQNITGLDVGREIFANIEQLSLFAMPAGDSRENSFLPGRLGLTITSRNPEQTRQLLATILGTISGAGDKPNSGQYKLSKQGQPDLYCYVEQVKDTTILSLNREVLEASVAALKGHKSICASGPLNGSVNKVAPATSKLCLVNIGGVIRLAEPFMVPGGLAEDQKQQFNDSLSQLARAAAATTLELRTDEEVNELALNASLTGIPPFQGVIGPATQIARIKNQAQAAALAKNLQSEAPAIVMPSVKAPVIDGKVDEAWNSAREYKITNVNHTPPSSPSDLSASFRTLWDEANLYVLVDVNDDILTHDSPPDSWYDSDSVEVYIDADNSKAPAYGENDYQFAFNWDKTSPTIQETRHHRTTGVEYAMVTTDKGYRLEIRFPWSTLGGKPSAGSRIGLDVQVNDSDGGGKRKSELTWHDQKDKDWQTPQAFGNAQLAGLVGWWKFDETNGTVANDSSGGNHSGALVGNAKWAPGKVGGAVDLDGAGSFVRIADKSAFDIGGEITIACWVNLRSVPAEWTGIVTKGDNAWRISTVEQQPQFHFAVDDFANGGEAVYVNGQATVRPGDWHHLAGVYDGKTIRLYLDGKLDATKARSGGLGQNDFEVLIGENAQMKGRSFNGLIDDVRIYNCALSEGEIKNLATSQLEAQR